MKDKKLNEESIVENMSGSIPAPEDVDYDKLITQALIEKYLDKESQVE